MDAARSLGMPHRTVMREVIVPQTFRIVIPPLTDTSRSSGRVITR